MRIALDYDDTFTADEGLWIRFVDLVKTRGHNIAFVTARGAGADNMDIETDAQMLGIDIVYCDAKPKADCFKADIWIDDAPLWIPSLDDMEAKVSLERVWANRGEAA